ncbi:hypothetical protein ACFLZ0_01860 [Patescibacteria group bacterium]
MKKQEIKTSFPDKEYLIKLVAHLKEKAEKAQSIEEQLLTASSISMNWIADYILDPNVKWTKEILNIDDLFLTGTCPKWNKIIIDRCGRSPKRLRELLSKNIKTKSIFKDVHSQSTNLPILVRCKDGKKKVLDGMHRVLYNVILGHTEIVAFIGKLQGEPRPQCEPHVVYDFLRAYHRGINRDKKGLITALRFLRKSYSNVDYLLRERFSKGWVPSDEIQEIIQKALNVTCDSKISCHDNIDHHDSSNIFKNDGYEGIREARQWVLDELRDMK